MDFEGLVKYCADFLKDSPAVNIDADTALDEGCAGLRLYDSPILGCSLALDPLFDECMREDVIGPHFMKPCEWLQGAKTVISFFLPSAEQVRRSNAMTSDWPSNEWMHGRVEGQKFVNALAMFLVDTLRAAGYDAVAPAADPRFKGGRKTFTSNWSERHVAYISGLGTFGLSRGLITELGCAGRLGSVITTLALPATERAYTGLYDNCTNCGACVRRCPVGAISLESGKAHAPCSAFLDEVQGTNPPYYGCGKCQTRVPCEHSIPKSARR